MVNYYEIIKTEFKTTVDSVMMHVLYSLLPGTQGLQGKQLESIGIHIRAPRQSTPAQSADIPNQNSYSSNTVQIVFFHA